MLKIIGIKLELLTDVDMFQYIERGLRGGVSNITHRHGKANNKYMNECDEKAPSKYIMYLDANNLYEWAMCKNLPTGGFRWLTGKEVSELSEVGINGYKEDSPYRGLILEVEFE